MKSFNRLPGWLKVIAPITFISLCLGINAIAFSEIRQSVTERRQAKATSPEQRSPAIIVQNTTASTAGSANQLVTTTSTDQPTQASERATSRTALPTAENSASEPPTNTQLSTESATEASATRNSAESATSVTPQPPASQAERSTDATAEPAAEPKYGHLPYPESNASEMALVASYTEGDAQRAETLHPEAAKALLEMIAAARSEGVWIVPASGFRTIAQQRTLFNTQITNKGTPEAAAKISAPPGYSEHHTGYAIDLVDGSLPQTQDITDSFAETTAYAWLAANAARHGFELSFPENNAQGISFEPWHWRYVGSAQARATLSLSAPTLDTRNATSSVTE